MNEKDNSSPSVNVASIISDELPDVQQMLDDAEARSVPLLPLRDMVMFPGQAVPVGIVRETSLQAVREAMQSGRLLLAAAEVDASIEQPTSKDMYKVGSLCRVVRVVDHPDGRHTAFVLSIARARITRFVRSNPYFMVKVSVRPEKIEDEKNDLQLKAALAVLHDSYQKLLINYSEDDRRELSFTLDNLGDTDRKVNFLCMQMPLDTSNRQHLLERDSLKDRVISLVAMLEREAQFMQIRRDIHLRTQNDLSEQQRQNFLEQQMRIIQDELNGGSPDDDITNLIARAEKMKWDEKMAQRFEKELARLQRYNPTSPEYAIQYGYIDTLLSLPWHNYTTDQFELKDVQNILDRDHYGLKDVKDRIIEQMAVLKQRGDVKAGILCLYGPPGVGKTSLGKSVAEAMGREYVRVSFGGLHDESEVRGHRRTYLGAMPGRIITGLQKCEAGNPVFVLDEIDKIGKDYKGDPAMALLEVLDPEQNDKFHDNFLDVDYDLSKILFIATANSLSTISGPLLDRMELIEISGYITEEKIEIAKRHLVPKKLDEHGLMAGEISFEDDALKRIVEEYTRESGVRQLDKKIAKVLRKIVRQKMSHEEYPKIVTADMIPTYLGKREVYADEYETNEVPGVVTGLAWTAAGGEILFIETSLSPGKGEKLSLTGQLGDVMKESATIALQWLKAHADECNIPQDAFTTHDIHIHVPEGAIPKDGPSAGVTMVTSLASALLGCKVRDRLAMTGEITLRGKVLPVGGIKEKILAAKRAGIDTIMLCEQNRKDIDEIDAMYLKGLTFHYVKTINEVLDFALLR